MAISVYFAEANFTAKTYAEVIKRLEKAGLGMPKGRLYHASYGDENNLQVFDVWESQETFAKFGETLLPIMARLATSHRRRCSPPCTTSSSAARWTILRRPRVTLGRWTGVALPCGVLAGFGWRSFLLALANENVLYQPRHPDRRLSWKRTSCPTEPRPWSRLATRSKRTGSSVASMADRTVMRSSM